MDTSEVLGALRNEIIESQKTQADFLKWKLIAVGDTTRDKRAVSRRH